MSSSSASSDDLRWMAAARRQAEEAANAGEVPIGAALIAGDALVAAAYNRTLADCDPTAHAEVVVLREAARRLRNHRLTGATLYVTLEPCIMCVGAAVQARVERIVFGCRDPKAGALGSVYAVAVHAALNHRFAVTAGVDETACRRLLQSFFRARREGSPV